MLRLVKTEIEIEIKENAYYIDDVLATFLILNLDRVEIKKNDVEGSILNYWNRKSKRKVYIKKIQDQKIMIQDRNILIKIDGKYYIRNLLNLNYKKDKKSNYKFYQLETINKKAK